MNPICSKCKYLSGTPVRLRLCAKIPIIHPDMLCSNENNMRKDNVTGELYTPYCEEVNRHAECLEYYPIDLKKPSITFEEDENLLSIYGSYPIIFTTDGTIPNAKMETVGEYDEEKECYIYEDYIDNSCIIQTVCVEDGVCSEIEKLSVEVPDVPEIDFDKETNTVTIKSYNTVRYTVDGSKVTEESDVYSKPFVIDHNTTVKAKSYARNDLSVEVSKYCIPYLSAKANPSSLFTSL
jgi:hypothetical protein